MTDHAKATITDERIAELKHYAVDLPGTFYRTINSEDVLGLIGRVETAEANAQRVAEEHIARGNAGKPDLSQRDCDCGPTCANLTCAHERGGHQSTWPHVCTWAGCECRSFVLGEGVSTTYPMPQDGWVCFHCGERFTTPGAARDHFGVTPDWAKAGCLIKAGEERGLLMELRRIEADRDNLRKKGLTLERDLRDARSAQPKQYTEAERKTIADKAARACMEATNELGVITTLPQRQLVHAAVLRAIADLEESRT